MYIEKLLHNVFAEEYVVCNAIIYKDILSVFNMDLNRFWCHHHTYSDIQLLEGKKLMIHLHRPQELLRAVHELQCSWKTTATANEKQQQLTNR